MVYDTTVMIALSAVCLCSTVLPGVPSRKPWKWPKGVERIRYEFVLSGCTSCGLMTSIQRLLLYYIGLEYSNTHQSYYSCAVVYITKYCILYFVIYSKPKLLLTTYCMQWA